MQYLVLGATGYLGSYIYSRLCADGCRVIGTSRGTRDRGELVYYDIQTSNVNDIIHKFDNRGEKTAIIGIAESKIDKCFENYSEAYEINVIKTKKMIYELLKEGFQIIYFSSDNVFDGITGNYTEENRPAPINKYGMMKSEMERELLNSKSEICILRISKVVSMLKGTQNFLTQLMIQIETGSVRCIKGNIMTFVCIEDIYQCCKLAAERKMRGLYNIAGDHRYSRADIAKKICDKMKRTNFSIMEYDVAEFKFKDNRPLDTSLLNQKFKRETGYQFMSMDAVIDKFIENMAVF